MRALAQVIPRPLLITPDDITLAVRKAFKLPEEKLELPFPRYGDKEGWKYYQHIEWVHRCFRGLFARPADWSQPMHPDCQLSICISVAGHNEEKNIYRTLAQFARQTAPQNSFEIYLFVNSPRWDGKGGQIEPDATLSEIQRARQDFPDLKIRMREVRYKTPVPIGAIRMHADVSALVGHYLRKDRPADHLLMRADSDCVQVHPRLVETYLKEARLHPETQLFRGPLSYNSEAALCSARALLSVTLHDFFDARRFAEGNMARYVGGANSTYRASAFLAVGGYRMDLVMGEDTNFGKRIVEHFEKGEQKKGNKEPEIKAAPVPMRLLGGTARIHTSMRRGEVALNAGFPVEYTWSLDVTEFQIDDRKVRNWAPRVQSEEEFERELASPTFREDFSGMLTLAAWFHAGSNRFAWEEITRSMLVERLGLPIYLYQPSESVTIMDAEKMKDILRGWRHYRLATLKC
jgi:hypothetical protein